MALASARFIDHWKRERRRLGLRLIALAVRTDVARKGAVWLWCSEAHRVTRSPGHQQAPATLICGQISSVRRRGSLQRRARSSMVST